jgi:hypothetical protein
VFCVHIAARQRLAKVFPRHWIRTQNFKLLCPVRCHQTKVQVTSRPTNIILIAWKLAYQTVPRTQTWCTGVSLSLWGDSRILKVQHLWTHTRKVDRGSCLRAGDGCRHGTSHQSLRPSPVASSHVTWQDAIRRFFLTMQWWCHCCSTPRGFSAWPPFWAAPNHAHVVLEYFCTQANARPKCEKLLYCRKGYQTWSQ